MGWRVNTPTPLEVRKVAENVEMHDKKHNGKGVYPHLLKCMIKSTMAKGCLPTCSMEEFMPYPWRVRDAKDGKGATAWAIGYGEKPGTKFTAVVTDVETGRTASRVVTVVHSR